MSSPVSPSLQRAATFTSLSPTSAYSVKCTSLYWRKKRGAFVWVLEKSIVIADRRGTSQREFLFTKVPTFSGDASTGLFQFHYRPSKEHASEEVCLWGRECATIHDQVNKALKRLLDSKEANKPLLSPPRATEIGRSNDSSFTRSRGKKGMRHQREDSVSASGERSSMIDLESQSRSELF
eukprot:TRINITY_DN2945_c0_g1_i1.p1 TRINITY_DN2945_c0_g1~~TRINITY_DN2945_c0_g1_i1.p1  ORF type:complete len:180 (+),score=31.96 TRINITY_DN2945_c0_g1_i1:26-565(+)